MWNQCPDDVARYLLKNHGYVKESTNTNDHGMEIFASDGTYAGRLYTRPLERLGLRFSHKCDAYVRADIFLEVEMAYKLRKLIEDRT